MEQLGVLAEALGETQDGVEADLTPARRRTGAGAIGEVLGDGDPFLRGVRRPKSGVLARAEKRDAVELGGAGQVRRLYEERYIPGQRLYFEECRPRERASIVIDNNDPNNATFESCSDAAQSA